MRKTFVGTEALTQRNDVRGRPSPRLTHVKPLPPHAFEVAARRNESNAKPCQHWRLTIVAENGDKKFIFYIV